MENMVLEELQTVYDEYVAMSNFTDKNIYDLLVNLAEKDLQDIEPKVDYEVYSMIRLAFTESALENISLKKFIGDSKVLKFTTHLYPDFYFIEITFDLLYNAPKDFTIRKAGKDVDMHKDRIDVSDIRKHIDKIIETHKKLLLEDLRVAEEHFPNIKDKLDFKLN